MTTETTTTQTITLTLDDLKEILCEKFSLKIDDTQMTDYTEWCNFSEDHVFAGIRLKTNKL